MNLRVELLLFMTGWGANHFSTLLVVYRRNLGLLPPALGILFGAYALGLVPGLVLAGRASDRRGRRAVVLPASLLAIAASAVLAFGERGFGVLLAGRLIYGLATGSVMSPGSVWVQELSSPATGARRATLALSAGFGLGPLVSGVIAEFAPAPMAWPYVVHAIAMAAALVQPATGSRDRAGRARRNRHAARAPRSRPPRVARACGAVAGRALGLRFSRGHDRDPARAHARARRAAGDLLGPGHRHHAGTGVAVQPLTSRLQRRGDLLGLALGALGIFLAALRRGDRLPGAACSRSRCCSAPAMAW